MTNGADFQQQQELLEQQRLLTKEAFDNWANNITPTNMLELYRNSRWKLTIRQLYLKEHGLPLTSKIEGL